jgi:hypothetical protein
MVARKAACLSPPVAFRRNMSSPEDAEGRRLLQAWKTTGAGIQMSFTDCEGLFGFRFVGHFDAGSDEDRVLLIGTGADFFLDIREARFKNVVSKEGLKRNALPSSTYGESVTISLVGKGDFILVTRPRKEPGELVN